MKALACATCISSAFGDRTFNWPYLSLIIAPFVVFAAVAAAVAWHAGVRPRTIVRWLADRLPGRSAGHHDHRLASRSARGGSHTHDPQKETT